MRRFARIAAVIALLWVSPAFAGGDDDPVRVVSLRMLSETDYILVVEPQVVKYPALPKCHRLEVQGTFERLEGAIPFIYKGGPSKKDHSEALQYLRQFVGTNRFVGFGWMGDGLRSVDDKNPCVVKSRALKIYDGAVLSFFHVV
jgi:hypothetical protein